MIIGGFFFDRLLLHRRYVWLKVAKGFHCQLRNPRQSFMRLPGQHITELGKIITSLKDTEDLFLSPMNFLHWLLKKKIVALKEWLFLFLQTICTLLECLLTPENVPSDSPKEVYEAYFVFACIWAFGGTLLQDQVCVEIVYRSSFIWRKILLYVIPVGLGVLGYVSIIKLPTSPIHS